MSDFFRAAFEAFWYLLPALIANTIPGIARKHGWPLSQEPVSVRWLGKRKTWGAWVYVPAAAIVVLMYFQCAMSDIFSTLRRHELFEYYWPHLLPLSLAFGFGTVLGDHGGSLIKRRLGWKHFYGLDQTGFLAASLALVWLFDLAPFVGLHRLGALAPFFVAWYVVGNRLGQMLGHRESWL